MDKPLFKKTKHTNGFQTAFRKNILVKIHELLSQEERKIKRIDTSKRQVHDIQFIGMMKKSIELHLNPPEPEPEIEFKPDEALLNKLITCGLSNNESRVYCLLLQKNKPLQAVPISRILQLPRTETYHIIHNLQDLGLVDVEPYFDTSQAKGFGMFFFIKEPSKAFSTLINNRTKISNNYLEQLLNEFKRFEDTSKVKK